MNPDNIISWHNQGIEQYDNESHCPASPKVTKNATF